MKIIKNNYKNFSKATIISTTTPTTTNNNNNNNNKKKKKKKKPINTGHNQLRQSTIITTTHCHIQNQRNPQQ